jgi:hypothetical protein
VDQKKVRDDDTLLIFRRMCKCLRDHIGYLIGCLLRDEFSPEKCGMISSSVVFQIGSIAGQLNLPLNIPLTRKQESEWYRLAR